MNNTKHTPGPWDVKHSESKPAFNVIGTALGGKYKIARCPYVVLQQGESRDILNDRECKEAEANAKLIAAAPEMLEALQVVMNDDIEWDAVEKMVKEAIKKATQ